MVWTRILERQRTTADIGYPAVIRSTRLYPWDPPNQISDAWLAIIYFQKRAGRKNVRLLRDSKDRLAVESWHFWPPLKFDDPWYWVDLYSGTLYSGTIHKYFQSLIVDAILPLLSCSPHSFAAWWQISPAVQYTFSFRSRLFPWDRACDDQRLAAAGSYASGFAHMLLHIFLGTQIPKTETHKTFLYEQGLSIVPECYPFKVI